MVIVLIVTPEGLPLTYEVMPGNTRDSATLQTFLDKIQDLYGEANRTWVMDREIPTEETLESMRKRGISYLVGTPKGRLTKLEKGFFEKDWQEARESVEVKLHREEEDLYILVKSERRVCKEMAMRRSKIKKLWKRLLAIRQMKISRDQLLQKVGAAKQQAGRLASLVEIHLPKVDQEINEKTFYFEINKDKMKKRRRHEGRYLLRSNLPGDNPSVLWENYHQLTEVEQAFKELKSDLSIRPIYHQKDSRIEAHVFVSFMAYCLNVTLKRLLKQKASGLSPRAVLEKMANIQMVDVHLPTTDDRVIVLNRYTKPEKEHELLLSTLGMKLPGQATPKLLRNRLVEAKKPENEPAAPPGSASPAVRSEPRFTSPGWARRKRPWESRVQFCSGDFYRPPPGMSATYPRRPP